MKLDINRKVAKGRLGLYTGMRITAQGKQDFSRLIFKFIIIIIIIAIIIIVTAKNKIGEIASQRRRLGY